jgi:hypothetical protein
MRLRPVGVGVVVALGIAAWSLWDWGGVLAFVFGAVLAATARARVWDRSHFGRRLRH